MMNKFDKKMQKKNLKYESINNNYLPYGYLIDITE